MGIHSRWACGVFLSDFYSTILWYDPIRLERRKINKWIGDSYDPKKQSNLCTNCQFVSCHSSEIHPIHIIDFESHKRFPKQTQYIQRRWTECHEFNWFVSVLLCIQSVGNPCIIKMCASKYKSRCHLISNSILCVARTLGPSTTALQSHISRLRAN